MIKVKSLKKTVVFLCIFTLGMMMYINKDIKHLRWLPSVILHYTSKGVTNCPDTNSPRNPDSKETKLILFYDCPSWFAFTSLCSTGVETCPVNSCRCSIDPSELCESDGVVIDAVDLRSPPPSKLPHQVWILFALETPFNFNSQFYTSKEWRGEFNWTMTYRRDSDIRVPYGTLVHQKNKSNKNYTDIALRKSRSAIWLVSNCNVQSKRESYVHNLEKYYTVDIYGGCGSLGKVSKDLSELVHDYRFYLSFENSLCVDYITEKFFKLFDKSIDIVPVVRGGADYASQVPAGTYINAADFVSPEMLAEYLIYLEQNATAYAEILQKKDEYVNRGFEKSLHSAFCDICIKLHDMKLPSKLYNDTGSWLTKNTCYEPTDLVL